MEVHDCNFRPDLGMGCINDRCPLHRAMRVFAANLRIAAALCRSHTLGEGFGYEWATREPVWPRWEPGCQRDASEVEKIREMPGAYRDIYGDRSKWRAP
jgi:hypothetical protein